MNNFLLDNIFNNSMNYTNVELLNMNTSEYIFNNKIYNLFNSLNSYLLNTNNKPSFLFQILELNINNKCSLSLISNFIDNWGNISNDRRQTVEYLEIYNSLLKNNKKNKINFKKIDFSNKTTIEKLSKYYLTGKDSLHILYNRIFNIKDKKETINYLLKNIDFNNDILTYNKLNSLYFDPIKKGKKKVKNPVLEYNISKYGYLFEIISACDHILLLRDLKNLNKNKIFIFKNFNYDEYKIYNNEILIKDYLENITEFYGHTGIMCLDFIKKELVYFDPDKLNKDYKSFIFINKINPLLKLAYNGLLRL